MLALEEMVDLVKENKVPENWDKLEEKDIEEQASEDNVDKQYLLLSRCYALACDQNGVDLARKYKKSCLASIKKTKISDWKLPEPDKGYSPLIIVLLLRDFDLLEEWLLALEQGRVPQFMIDWVITVDSNEKQGTNALYLAIDGFNYELPVPDNARVLYKSFALKFFASGKKLEGICQHEDEQGFTSLMQAIRSGDVDLITACTNAVKAGKASQEMMSSEISDSSNSFQGMNALHYALEVYNEDDSPQPLKDCCKVLALVLIEKLEKIGGKLLRGDGAGNTALIEGFWTEDTEIVTAFLGALKNDKVEHKTIDSVNSEDQNALQIALDYCIVYSKKN